jgi:cell division protein FtsN
MRIIKVLVIISFLVYISGCSSSQQTQNTEAGKDSVYVFDSVPDTQKDDIPELEYPDLGTTYYIVQIGAFTTKERAKNFEEESSQLLPYDIKIGFSRNNNLYVVQLSEYYTSRSRAESVRNDLWKMEKFRDAWILTVNK